MDRWAAWRRIAFATSVWLLIAAPVAAADPAVYSLVRVSGGVSGVAVLGDGSILYSSAAWPRVVRRYVDGRETRFARLTKPGKLAVVGDGSVLISHSPACGGCARVVRIAPDAAFSVVAGRSDPPDPSRPWEVGDGGPATEARLSNSWMAPLADGGLLLADSPGLRRISPDGTITTIARLEGTTDVAVLSDGSFAVVAYGRVARVTPDGTVRTLTRSRATTPTSVAAAAPGGLVYTSDGGLVRYLSPAGGSRPLAGNLGLRSRCEGWWLSRAGLFNGEGVSALRALLCKPVAIARDPLGGWLVGDANGISMIARPGAVRMGVAVTRPEAHRGRVWFSATTRGTARLEVTGPGQTVRLSRAVVRPGTNVIRLPRGARPGASTAVLRARSAAGSVDEDRIGLVLGGRLAFSYARGMIEGDIRFSDARAADASPEYVDACRQFGSRRVDCVVRSNDYDECVEILYLRLMPTGLLREGSYRCRHGGPFRRRIPSPSETWPLPML